MRPVLTFTRSLRPVGPSTCLQLFCSFQLWLWRSAFQSFTDEAHRRVHAPLRGKPPPEGVQLREKVSPLFHSENGGKKKTKPTFPTASRTRISRAYSTSPI